MSWGICNSSTCRCPNYNSVTTYHPLNSCLQEGENIQKHTYSKKKLKVPKEESANIIVTSHNHQGWIWHLKKKPTNPHTISSNTNYLFALGPWLSLVLIKDWESPSCKHYCKHVFWDLHREVRKLAHDCILLFGYCSTHCPTLLDVLSNVFF